MKYFLTSLLADLYACTHIRR